MNNLFVPCLPPLGSLRLWPEEHPVCAAYTGRCEETEPRRARADGGDESPARHEPQ